MVSVSSIFGRFHMIWYAPGSFSTFVGDLVHQDVCSCRRKKGFLWSSIAYCCFIFMDLSPIFINQKSQMEEDVAKLDKNGFTECHRTVWRTPYMMRLGFSIRAIPWSGMISSMFSHRQTFD